MWCDLQKTFGMIDSLVFRPADVRFMIISTDSGSIFSKSSIAVISNSFAKSLAFSNVLFQM